MSVYPLPELIELNSFDGDWEAYKTELYRLFCSEILQQLSYDGLPISCRYFEPVAEMHRSFWHLITDNPENSANDEDRIPDLRRCERIRWVAHLIRQAGSPEVKCFETRRNGNTNVVIWLPAESYMIVLSKRSGYYLLTTAFTHGAKRSRDNQRDWEAYDASRNS